MKPLKFRMPTGNFSREFRQAFAGVANPIAIRATRALDQVGEDMKRDGRVAIGAAGFGKKWQNALRTKRYPPREPSLDAVLFVYHKIDYAEVFETGATINGQPYLWLPLPAAPAKVGRYKMTPKRFVENFGRLTFVQPNDGGNPVLVANYKGRANSKRFSKAGFKKGGAGEEGSGVPVFVGIPAAKMPKRFGLYKIFSAAARRLGSYYLAASSR